MTLSMFVWAQYLSTYGDGDVAIAGCRLEFDSHGYGIVANLDGAP